MNVSMIKPIKFFLDHLRVTKNSSAHTINAYERDLKQFEEISKGKSLLKVGESDIQSYLKDLRKRDQKPASISRKISAIRQFYKFLLQENLIQEDPSLFIESPKASKKLPKAISPEVLEKILTIAEKGSHYEDEKTEKAQQKVLALRIRDRAMIYFLYATGVRVSELITLTMSQADLDGGFARVMGKRRKERMVPFAPIVTRYLDSYLESARPFLVGSDARRDSGILFVAQGGEGLTRQGFWKTLKKIATIAGLEQSLHPHMLRHTFATDLLKSGMDLRALQMLLGHADLQTTQVYTHIAPDHLQNVIKKYHPRGGK